MVEIYSITSLFGRGKIILTDILKSMNTQVQTKKTPTFSLPSSIKQPIYISWGVSFLILLLSIIYYFLAQPELPIFYSLARKIDHLAPKEYIFLFALISFTFNFIHLFFINYLKNYSKLLLKLFVGTTFALQIVLIMALLRIVLITI